MTRNQIEALKLQEVKRANLENERLKRASLPAEYLSSVGGILGGAGRVGSAIGSIVSNRNSRPRDNYKQNNETFQWRI